MSAFLVTSNSRACTDVTHQGLWDHALLHLRNLLKSHSPARRNLRQYPEAEGVPGMLLARVGASIYFANMQYIVERLGKFVLRAQVCF